MNNSQDPLSSLQFKDKDENSNSFIKFVAGTPVKVRVLTTNPTIHVSNYGKEQISFAVWSWDEGRPMILSKGPSIARQISSIHTDEDFGADITKLDIKILPTGEGMNREYAINVLPKPQGDLTDEQTQAVLDLDKNFSKIFKGSVRAEEYNNGVKPEGIVGQDSEVHEDIVLEDLENDGKINLKDIPFN